MSIEEFFSHLLDEIRESNYLGNYYKFQKKDGNFYFRKNYFLKRLDYINRSIKKNRSKIWDSGCGYGTTAIFLSLNGHDVFGNTVGDYFKKIPGRANYWQKFGDVSSFEYSYSDLFDSRNKQHSFDYIIVQDALHHFEPIDKAIDIFASSLNNNGKIIVIEENGQNLIQRTKDFLKRGTKRKKIIFDKVLSKEMEYGIENIRTFETWKEIFNKKELIIDDVEFIRVFPPFFWSKENYNNLSEKEKLIWRKSSFLRKYFYFGINFTVSKNYNL